MSPEPRGRTNPEPDEYAGWTGAETETPGVQSRMYTHPQYTGWEIYVNHPHGFAAIYRDGTKVENCEDLAAAVALITDEIVPDNRRVDFDGNPLR